MTVLWVHVFHNRIHSFFFPLYFIYSAPTVTYVYDGNNDMAFHIDQLSTPTKATTRIDKCFQKYKIQKYIWHVENRLQLYISDLCVAYT